MCNCEKKLKELLLKFYEAQKEECEDFCYGGMDVSEECERKKCKWVPILKNAKIALNK